MMEIWNYINYVIVLAPGPMMAASSGSLSRAR